MLEAFPKIVYKCFQLLSISIVLASCSVISQPDTPSSTPTPSYTTAPSSIFRDLPSLTPTTPRSNLIPASPPIISTQTPSSRMEYSIFISTSDDAGAGTDAKVYLEIIGTLGSSDLFELDHPDHDGFKAGSTVWFQVTLPELGFLDQVCIEHDNTGDSPGWQLTSVQITDSQNLTYLFQFHQWLSLDEEPFQLRVCQTVTQPQ